jgi:hypothetical protein
MRLPCKVAAGAAAATCCYQGWRLGAECGFGVCCSASCRWQQASRPQPDACCYGLEAESPVCMPLVLHNTTGACHGTAWITAAVSVAVAVLSFSLFVVY